MLLTNKLYLYVTKTTERISDIRTDKVTHSLVTKQAIHIYGNLKAVRLEKYVESGFMIYDPNTFF